MKFIIASDIHGSAKFCRQLLERMEREQADKLLLLGDILYHGPRNPLPEEYAPHRVIEMLNKYADKIICVRGNCDSEVDQMVLSFPILSDYATVFADGLTFTLSHGHKDTPPLGKNDVYLTGHTHVPLCESVGYLHLNPGSVSLPKGDSHHSYISYENRKFLFKTMFGSGYKRIEI